MIALPLQGQALKNGNSAFVDENWNAYPEQWNILFSTKRLSKQKIEKILSDFDVSADDTSNEPVFGNDHVKPWEKANIFLKMMWMDL